MAPFFNSNVGLVYEHGRHHHQQILISCPGSYSKIYSKVPSMLMVLVSGSSSGCWFLPLEVCGTSVWTPDILVTYSAQGFCGQISEEASLLVRVSLPCASWSATPRHFHRVLQSRLNAQKHVGLPGRQARSLPVIPEEDLRMTKMMLIIFVSWSAHLPSCSSTSSTTRLMCPRCSIASALPGCRRASTPSTPQEQAVKLAFKSCCAARQRGARRCGPGQPRQRTTAGGTATRFTSRRCSSTLTQKR